MKTDFDCFQPPRLRVNQLISSFSSLASVPNSLEQKVAKSAKEGEQGDPKFWSAVSQHRFGSNGLKQKETKATKGSNRLRTIMNNETWVCFDCREAVRRDAYHPAEVPCPSCGHVCLQIGDRIRIPSKSNARGWQRLRESLCEQRLGVLDTSQIAQVRQRHELEQQLLQVGLRSPNEGRAKSIRTLRKKLDSM